jgi:hypothetical protein
MYKELVMVEINAIVSRVRNMFVISAGPLANLRLSVDFLS